MLPLVQTHPRVVPTNFDAFGASASGHGARPEHERRAIASPYHRSSPVRPSQIYYDGSAISADQGSRDHDYHLRRKTPRGTIDAGYDGSPTQLSPGPPPLKQLILPTPSGIYPYLPPNNLPFHAKSRILEHEQRCLGQAAPLTSPWPISHERPDFVLCSGSSMTPQPGLSWQPNGYSMFSQIPDMYQPLMRAAEYNVRAFCPPPASMPDTSTFDQFSWQLGSSQQNYGYLDTSRHFSQRRMPPGLSGSFLQHGSDAQLPYRPVSDFKPNFNASQSSQPLLHGRYLDQSTVVEGSAASEQYAVRSSFTEKALSQAQEHYVELLSYLQTARKFDQISGGASSNPRPKILVFPKLPKSRKENFGILQDVHRSVERPTSSTIMLNSRPQALTSNIEDTLGGNTRRQIRQDGQVEAQQSSASTMQIRASPTSYNASSTPNALGPVAMAKALPVLNARNSLDILKSLCEQSNWKWIDGILLGGCLLYGLSRFEDAVEWFSRVITLDSSHVEAITNIAATLYCLNRHEEAEQHWLNAIKLCPSHLEATEQLVGLLYKKRYREAIDIICFVQQALKLAKGSSAPTTYSASGARSVSCDDHNGHPHIPQPTLPHYGYQPEAAPLIDCRNLGSPDFGSSGYALPNCDNGRILALVHAKGTILYGLKDIERASEAFEEAVLISVGEHIESVQALVNRIHAVLSPVGSLPTGNQRQVSPRPLLLPPEKARQTAHLVFAAGGRGSELPGLASVPEGAARRVAVQTTSNALLSLAKIFQDAMSGGGIAPTLLRQPSGIGDILALYYLSLSLQESPSTANNIGILLAGVQQIAASNAQASGMVSSRPSLPGVVPGSGLALALAYYNYGLRLDPRHVHLHTNLGSLLKDVGQLDLAIQMYERAVSCDRTFDIALTNLANAVKDKGRIKDAIAYYRRAVDTNPEFAEAVCGLLTALNSVCDWRGRGGALLELGKYDRWHVDDKGTLVDVQTAMRGSGLTQRVIGIISQQLDDASQWGCNILQQPTINVLVQQLKDFCRAPGFDLEEALSAWARQPWEGSRLVRLVERATRVILWTWYHDQHVAKREVTPSRMQSVFGFHNPRRARAFCYATTPSDRSIHRQQIEREAPVFRDVSSWPADKLIEQINRDKIHILVNLNGYTRGARNEIFAARPAPIQMSFMGFAGTLGAEWCDYILADATAVPLGTLRPWRTNTWIEDLFHDNTEGDGLEWMYSENIIFCRDSFFCCDHAQSCDRDERGMTWDDEEKRRWKMRKELFPTIPEDVIILANFNQLYKASETCKITSWLRILARTPKAVLWLLRFPELGEVNLRQTAESWAGAEVASRLIFTDVAPKSQHITRARVCDLFLDTAECNAHTTAADVLWSSTPLLTLPRYSYKMCSRMAASILRGALPKSAEGQQAARELIAKSETEYEDSATELAGGLSYRMTDEGYGQGTGRLADIRKLLWESRWQCGLFNTRRWVNDLETAYEEAWRRWVVGKGGDIYL
ncbi:udp-n-acetylglucosamine--peptide n-acetylglucosaminyltransferase sec [Trichoderma arundinaceum]|uniref:protein O-GlcNAc transferase n=1 Tax=Trichoderma arundinaceum TaxID=490622 RepID=A0A395NRN0_TRIAR|nr:udp-n-acetylglucosamine--peptide n-acetylglucosaminyltransferase sec [Trichoderma arundinaceum]